MLGEEKLNEQGGAPLPFECSDEIMHKPVISGPAFEWRRLTWWERWPGMLYGYFRRLSFMPWYARLWTTCVWTWKSGRVLPMPVEDKLAWKIRFAIWMIGWYGRISRGDPAELTVVDMLVAVPMALLMLVLVALALLAMFPGA